MQHIIRTVTLPGAGQLDLCGLIVVVGPNSSGKTNLLRDLTLQRKSPVVCIDVSTKPPDDVESFINELIGHRLMEVEPRSGTLQVRTSWIGTCKPIADGAVNSNSVRNWHKPDKPGHVDHKAVLDKFFAPLLTAQLFLDTRLEMTAESSAFDSHKESPQNEIQSLFLSRRAQDELNAEIGRSFGKSVGLDPSTKNKLILRVRDRRESSIPHFLPEDATADRAIEVQGEGLRSYVSVCMALLTSFRPLVLIDEPETFLHPPQAYAIGRFIGRHQKPEIAIVVSTHSSHVLRGLIEHSPMLTVVRMTNYGERFNAHIVPNEMLRDVLQRPIVRADEVLDGVFADAVVIVEADTDRLVYEAAYEVRPRDRHLDAQFVSVDGLSAIPPTAQFFRALRIPVCAITDLDVVVAPGNELRSILNSLSDDLATIDSIVLDADALKLKIKAIKPDISVDDVKTLIQECVVKCTSFEDDNDIEIQRSLSSISNRLKRSRAIKKGLDALDDKLAREVLALIDKMNRLGLFAVPVGQLEHWLPGQVMTSVEKKARWAIEASQLIKREPERAEDLIKYISNVADYLDRCRATRR